MYRKHLITVIMLVLIAALGSSCSKNQSEAQRVTISADQETNVTTVTTNGYTFMIGKTLTNNPAGSKPSP